MGSPLKANVTSLMIDSVSNFLTARCAVVKAILGHRGTEWVNLEYQGSWDA